MLYVDQMAETVQATVHALHISKANALEQRALIGYHAPHTYWMTAGPVEYKITVSEIGVKIFRMYPRGWVRDEAEYGGSALTRQALSRHVCQFLTGADGVLIDSRRDMRRIIEVAKLNARSEYRKGLNYIIEGHPVEQWGTLDTPDRWDAVVRAAYHGDPTPRGYMWYYRKCGVSMHAFDVYDDAYIEEAANLLDTLEVVS